ncbi:helix-turn-helix domain-containing protein [Zavarzinella formosa]|uniref:helix-turn-helix domain-containing protein n=1 Tax=Zavarzinella formosa TaxID=360055 RepID=UPI00036284EE|nr:helix-turn-helix domain-containing protein [Zavarzinella formosa]
MDEANYCSPAEFAQLCGLSLVTIRRLMRSGRLPSVQPGGPRHRILIPCDALDRLLPATGRVVHPEKLASGTITDPPKRLSGPLPKWLREKPC